MVPSCTARIPFPDVKTIVVIGATGHFGARICRRLLGEPNIRLIVTSRSASRAESFSRELREAASNTAVIAAAIYLMVSKNWS